MESPPGTLISSESVFRRSCITICGISIAISLFCSRYTCAAINDDAAAPLVTPCVSTTAAPVSTVTTPEYATLRAHGSPSIAGAEKSSRSCASDTRCSRCSRPIRSRRRRSRTGWPSPTGTSGSRPWRTRSRGSTASLVGSTAFRSTRSRTGPHRRRTRSGGARAPPRRTGSRRARTRCRPRTPRTAAARPPAGSRPTSRRRCSSASGERAKCRGRCRRR